MKGLRTKLRPHHHTINILCFILGAAIVVYLTNNFFAVFAPFVVAYVVTQLLRPLLKLLQTKTKIPDPLCALMCLLLFVVIFVGAVWLCGYYLVEGISKVIEILSSENVLNGIVAKCQNYLKELRALTEFLHVNMSGDDIAGLVRDMATKAIAALSNFSINFALKVPQILISIIIGCVASFYMLCDYNKISAVIKNALSPRFNLLIDVFNKKALSSFVRMLCSYIVISAVCFCELLIGFLIIGINDAVLIALIIAVFDVLPILGSGAILIPWGIISILAGAPMTGVGLIVLWGIILIVKQIIEPKIVGSQIGLHPLVTIASLYIGLQLMGGLGLIVAPLYIITYQKFQEAIRDDNNQMNEHNTANQDQIESHKDPQQNSIKNQEKEIGESR